MIMSTKEICKRGLSMTISLTLGNSGFPFADRLIRDMQLIGQLFLGHSFFLPQPGDKCAELFSIQLVHILHLLPIL